VTQTLNQLQPGAAAVVLEVKTADQPVCLRLAEMGLVPGTPVLVLVLSNHSGLMIQVGEQCLCLSGGLAEAVQVLAV
jgi:Fe2+ transport system protein FeoA